MIYFIGVHEDYRRYLQGSKLSRKEVWLISSYEKVLGLRFKPEDVIEEGRHWLVDDYHKISSYIRNHKND